MLIKRFGRSLWSLGLLVIFGGLAGLNLQEALWCNARMIVRVPTTHKVVALSIDDGPHVKTTPEILAVLREKKVHATFFVLGSNAEKHPNLLAQQLADGHELGNHAYSHALLPSLSKERIDTELSKTERAIVAAGYKPTLFRPPGGEYNKKVLALAQDKGYTIIMWTIDPSDWQCPPASTVVDRVMAQVKPGSIILLHDGQYPLPTPKALGIMIDRLRDQGYQIVTVSELLDYYEVRTAY